MVGDHIGHCIQGPAHISKYGNYGYAKGEIAKKQQKNQEKNREKNRGWLVTILGIVFRVQRTFPNLESVGMLNEKYQ